MGDLGRQLQNLTVKPGTAAVAWLGQAGFVIKTPHGVTVMIDPYLSDYAELIWGVRRAYPTVLEPTEFAPDLLLISHWHEDHLDRTTVVAYRDQPGVVLAGPESCLARAQAWGWPADRCLRLERDEVLNTGDLTVTATFVRHEDPLAQVPDAVGFLIDAGAVRMWYVGDTEYDARLRPFRGQGIDVMLVPINGGGGNMNVYEAAFLAWWVAPTVAVPMHYDMWTPEGFGPDATLDPDAFTALLDRLDAPVSARLMRPGELALFDAAKP
jgi:L-ascorbate metabolism protein UlaG (beta-lactamase superfamily)